MKPYPAEPRHPEYLSLNEEQWEAKLQRSKELASPCVLCGRRYHAPRFIFSENTGTATRPARGICETQDKAVVANAGPHFGEEPPLVGQRGSGTGIPMST
jgi:putative pyruvate formate lyase activating enzyme